MTGDGGALPTRRRWQGAGQILRYNRPAYLAAALATAALAGGAWLTFLPNWARAACLAAAVLVFAAAAASLLVAHAIYDRSPLHRWTWLTAGLPEPGSWLVLHAGLDEATPALRRLYPGAAGLSLDIYDAAAMDKPSIRAARVQEAAESPCASHAALPVPDGRTDLLMLFFVAHELRAEDDQGALLQEVHRVLRAGAMPGRAVVVEHLRDVPNGLAFGPGALHFFGRRRWLRVFGAAGLAVRQELRITPFVRAFFLEAT